MAASHELDRADVRNSLDDPQAFGGIFERHFDDVRRYLVRRVGTALGDELASETFVRAFDGRARFDAKHGVVRAWLFGIAANLLRRRARSEECRLRAYARSGCDPIVDQLDGVPARIDAQRSGPRLAAALADLSSGEREVVLLYAWAELSYDEIAVALELPLGTVRSRLSRRPWTTRRGGPRAPRPRCKEWLRWTLSRSCARCARRFRRLMPRPTRGPLPCSTRACAGARLLHVASGLVSRFRPSQ